MSERRPALGKGLSALIPDAQVARPSQTEVDIDLLSPNEQQPRVQMDGARLDELAESIRANGIIQPIVVRRAGEAYRIIAGERRWRAAQRAGLLKVPVVIRDVEESSPNKLLELALVENIQRENLNPVDEALAYQRLAEEHGLTQDQIATAVGKDRSSVANFLRLLKLPEEVRNDLAAGALSMGHARALLGLPDEVSQRHVSREVISRGLSVRDTEALVKKTVAAAGPSSSPKVTAKEGVGTGSEPAGKDVHTRAAEDRLRFALGTKVRIARKAQGGTIEIDFGSEDELNRLYELLIASR
jgi:ParB family chromosome partitioning protein